MLALLFLSPIWLVHDRAKMIIISRQPAGKRRRRKNRAHSDDGQAPFQRPSGGATVSMPKHGSQAPIPNFVLSQTDEARNDPACSGFLALFPLLSCFFRDGQPAQLRVLTFFSPLRMNDNAVPVLRICPSEPTGATCAMPTQSPCGVPITNRDVTAAAVSRNAPDSLKSPPRE